MAVHPNEMLLESDSGAIKAQMREKGISCRFNEITSCCDILLVQLQKSLGWGRRSCTRLRIESRCLRSFQARGKGLDDPRRIGRLGHQEAISALRVSNDHESSRATVPQRSRQAALDRGHRLLPMLDAAVYKHVVLGLIFLKYVSDAFKERRVELEDNFRDPVSMTTILVTTGRN